MTDITAELAALPKMPDPKGNVVGNAFIIERYYALVPRLAIAERQVAALIAAAAEGHPLCGWMVGDAVYDHKAIDDARAYLAFREKEQW